MARKNGYTFRRVKSKSIKIKLKNHTLLMFLLCINITFAQEDTQEEAKAL